MTKGKKKNSKDKNKKEEYRSPTPDELWKLLIENFFKEFVQAFLPDFHKQIDFTKPVNFLDKELVSITSKKKVKGIVDILVMVTLKNGKKEGILFHVEVQGKQLTEFPKRMFRYHIRIWDKHELPITALAVVTPGVGRKHTIPTEYNYEHFGTKMTL